jgi:hypothetical protein
MVGSASEKEPLGRRPFRARWLDFFSFSKPFTPSANLGVAFDPDPRIRVLHSATFLGSDCFGGSEEKTIVNQLIRESGVRMDKKEHIATNNFHNRSFPDVIHPTECWMLTFDHCLKDGHGLLELLYYAATSRGHGRVFSRAYPKLNHGVWRRDAAWLSLTKLRSHFLAARAEL